MIFFIGNATKWAKNFPFIFYLLMDLSITPFFSSFLILLSYLHVQADSISIQSGHFSVSICEVFYSNFFFSSTHKKYVVPLFFTFHEIMQLNIVSTVQHHRLLEVQPEPPFVRSPAKATVQLPLSPLCILQVDSLLDA